MLATCVTKSEHQMPLHQVTTIFLSCLVPNRLPTLTNKKCGRPKSGPIINGNLHLVIVILLHNPQKHLVTTINCFSRRIRT